jgi:hypothetical protein
MWKMKYYPMGKELTADEAKSEMITGNILITKDGTEKAMYYKGTFACWGTGGNLGDVLMFLADFTGWHIQGYEDGPETGIETKKHFNIATLNKCFFN